MHCKDEAQALYLIEYEIKTDSNGNKEISFFIKNASPKSFDFLYPSSSYLPQLLAEHKVMLFDPHTKKEILSTPTHIRAHGGLVTGEYYSSFIAIEPGQRFKINSITFNFTKHEATTTGYNWQTFNLSKIDNNKNYAVAYYYKVSDNNCSKLKKDFPGKEFFCGELKIEFNINL